MHSFMPRLFQQRLLRYLACPPLRFYYSRRNHLHYHGPSLRCPIHFHDGIDVGTHDLHLVLRNNYFDLVDFYACCHVHLFPYFLLLYCYYYFCTRDLLRNFRGRDAGMDLLQELLSNMAQEGASWQACRLGAASCLVDTSFDMAFLRALPA